MVAFTRAVSETLGEESKWVHYGLTSTDVVDTAYGYLYKQANDIIRRDLANFWKLLLIKRVSTSTLYVWDVRTVSMQNQQLLALN